MLFDKDCADFSRNHGDDGSDVTFESVGEATPSRNAALVELGLSYAFHLFTTSDEKEGEKKKTKNTVTKRSNDMKQTHISSNKPFYGKLAQKHKTAATGSFC